ncbi:MAG: hypothetical protein EOS82_03165 [Mesorhizobium sp.]|uniref:DUF7666 domain-containing protein n=1 Tax=Mesorhizobium sp. TaxID=1871066 RepID=UPI000FE890E1|nr:hypothetical protein [Mesorhizobium sp.]RWQ56510.1 MAG: hypothetical protein EOS82_03165 [Mesorhizobium sp.]
MMARTKKTAEAIVETAPPIIAYKGFNQDFACTPDGKLFQYEVGKSYQHDGDVVACGSGFHACEHPLNVFTYYPPATSRYAVVELGGKTAREKGGDTKIAAAEITIRAELQLPELVAAAIRYVFDRAKWISGPFASGNGEGAKETKDGGAATASGIEGAATASGTRGAATASGTRGAATASGYQGAATASGWRGAATTSGYQGAATASGWRGAATASGDQGAATASGDQGAATASGTRGAATASGYEGKARGKDGCALFLVERSTNGEILNAWAGIVGRDGIKADTFYRIADGKPVEVA